MIIIKIIIITINIVIIKIIIAPSNLSLIHPLLPDLSDPLLLRLFYLIHCSFYCSLIQSLLPHFYINRSFDCSPIVCLLPDRSIHCSLIHRSLPDPSLLPLLRIHRSYHIFKCLVVNHYNMSTFY